MKITKLIVASLMAVSAISANAQTNILIDGSTTVGPISKAFAEYFKETNPEVNITISESGSGNGAKSLTNASCDIANLSRFMKAGEFAACVKNEVCPVAHVVAYDGLAVIVNPDNGVSALTDSQIKDIYTGKITNWKDLGGKDSAIVVISRDTNSGTYETFNSIVLKKEAIVASAEYVNSNGQARTRVSDTKSAIAYVGLGFVDGTTKPLTVNGVLPSAKTVKAGKYPISRPLYMFTNGYPAMGSPIFSFVTLHLTKDGAEMITDLGYVPVAD
ncbi:MAG: phosphate ABC transporter substrate-binding protein [Opitutales bacterium]